MGNRIKIFKCVIPVIIFCLAVAGATACGVEEERVPGNIIPVREEQLTVLPLQTMAVVVVMEAGQLLIGNVTIEGGDADIRIFVKDDYGEEIADFGIVTGNQNIAYKATKTGYYTIYFDNSLSVTVNKDITLHYSVR